MSIFKEHKTSADRSASDRRRHKEKITRAIREGVYNIVSDESIIGKAGKKRIKIPVKGIKEYRFVYGENEKNPEINTSPVKIGINSPTKILILFHEILPTRSPKKVEVNTINGTLTFTISHGIFSPAIE